MTPRDVDVKPSGTLSVVVFNNVECCQQTGGWLNCGRFYSIHFDWMHTSTNPYLIFEWWGSKNDVRDLLGVVGGCDHGLGYY